MAEHVVNLVDTQHTAVCKPENSESRPKMRRGFAGAGTGYGPKPGKHNQSNVGKQKNSLARVGPAHVQHTSARITISPIRVGHIDRGVSVLRALGTSACARMSM
jgi:hypothetical protein